MNLAIASHLASSTAAATTAVNMKKTREKMWWNEISWHILQRYQHIQQQRDTIMSNTFHEMRWEIHTHEKGQCTRKGTKQRVEERVGNRKKPCGRAVKIRPKHFTFLVKGVHRDWKSHWKDESRNSLWWHWWKPWWSINTWQMNNTMWIKQHTRHKRVCCFLRCCCVVRRVRTWEEEEKLWAIPISRRPPGGHFINYFALLTAHSIQNLFWTQFRVTTQIAEWRLPTSQPWRWW